MKAPWDEKETEILRKMVEAGKSAEDVGKVLVGRSSNAIRSKVNSIGMAFHATPEIDFEAFKQIMKTVRCPKCV